jgi:hypothetical protein
MKPAEQKPACTDPLREVRFSLRTLVAEVTEERRRGSFGSEKLHQSDLRRIFKRKGRARG